jgi:uncharacterized protein (DUF1684 family)
MAIQESIQLYEAEISTWRQSLDERLRRDDSWLTLAGLHWLHQGQNTAGTHPACEILLPPDSAPDQLGVIDFHEDVATLTVTCAEPVTVDSSPASSAVLRDDNHNDGPSIVAIRAISFFVIKRENHYGIRVRDTNNPARKLFTGRKWYPINPDYHLTAKFIAHPTPRTLTVINSVGLPAPMENPGYAEFELHGQTLRLEAFTANESELWFIFRDGTSGKSTYGSGRFLYGKLHQDNTIDLDFNRTYNPPCCFTIYATCPLPPKENILSIPIEAGEVI